MNNETTNTTTNTIETPATADVQIKDAPKAKAKKTTDADKINLLEKAAKKAGNDLTVTIAPAKSKKSPVKKDAEPKPKTKVKAKAAKIEPEKLDISKVEPLKVAKELLDAKLAALDKKLSKEKLTVTRNAFHVSYGYFLARAKSGKVLTIEFHQTLKPHQWVIRDEKSKVIGEPVKTLWKAHETAINL